MSPITGPKIGAPGIWAALTKRYAPPQWALLAEVGNSTGYGASRWADALAMGLWPSRGLHLHGFEIKVSRSDWRRELANPAKAEEIAPYCDFWWVVTTKGVVEHDELPATWGLMEMDGRGLRVVRQAPQNAKAVPLDTPMVAAILRRATEHMIPRAAAQESIDQARLDGIDEGRKTPDPSGRDRLEELNRIEKSYNALSDAVASFNRRSGLDLGAWNGSSLGDMVRIAQQVRNASTSIHYALGSAREAHERLQEAYAALGKAQAPPEETPSG